MELLGVTDNNDALIGAKRKGVEGREKLRGLGDIGGLKVLKVEGHEVTFDPLFEPGKSLVSLEFVRANNKICRQKRRLRHESPFNISTLPQALLLGAHNHTFFRWLDGHGAAIDGAHEARPSCL